MSSLAATIEPQATYADLLAIPEPLVAEILCGELHTHPRPTPSHAVTSSSIGDELVSPFHKGRGGPGGGWILDEPEMHLGEHVLVPDLAGWCRERLPKIPETAYFELALDWVCEVLSPSTARTARVLKPRFMWNSELPTASWWTRKSSCWKPLPCKTGNGLCWGVTEETMTSVLHRLTRSLFRSPRSGRSECGGSCAIFQPKASASLFASTNGAFKHNVLRI